MKPLAFLHHFVDRGRKNAKSFCLFTLSDFTFGEIRIHDEVVDPAQEIGSSLHINKIRVLTITTLVYHSI